MLAEASLGLGYPDIPQRFNHLLICGPLRFAEMDAGDFGELPAHAQCRIERRTWVLIDESDACGQPVRARTSPQIHVPDAQGVRLDIELLRQQSGDGHRGQRLSGTGLTDYAEDL